MINKTDGENTPTNGALTPTEKEELLLNSFGELRSEIHSLAKQISFVQTLEKNILLLMLCFLIAGGIVGVFVVI